MEVFEGILQRLPHYEPRALLRTWIFRIARNRCITSRRKVWHWLQLFVAHGADIAATSVSDVPLSPDAQHEAQAEHTRWQDQLRRLQSSLPRLRARERDLLMRHYYEELSFRAMAQQLRLPEATVRRAVHAAEARLLKLMTQEEAG
jgi:RNA polymerase sigma factor (sigma-70 family)